VLPCLASVLGLWPWIHVVHCSVSRGGWSSVLRPGLRRLPTWSPASVRMPLFCMALRPTSLSSALQQGDGFVCGLLLDTRQPYCWGSNSYVKSGVPQPMIEGAKYSELSAGDNHLCAVQANADGIHGANGGSSVVDCWGYNMTATHVFPEPVSTISAGSVFNCGLYARNRTVFCWGDETVAVLLDWPPGMCGSSL
jgi:hypothetical protein